MFVQNCFSRAFLLCSLGLGLTGNFQQAEAQVILLGNAESFSVLAHETVTSTEAVPLTTILGDVGVSPGTSITGLLPTQVTDGAIHINDDLSILAQIDAVTAYNQLKGLTVSVNGTLTGQNLGERTLTPGVYFFASEALMGGVLTLDGLGQSNPLFVFQIGSALTVASTASVKFINGAMSCDTFFQVGSSTTIGTYASFAGTVISLASDTMNTGATLDGRLFALTGAVTLDSNTISNLCVMGETVTDPSGTVTAVPEASLGLYGGAGLALFAFFGRRFRSFRRTRQ